MSPRIVHHTYLRLRGGAARVAQLLLAEQTTGGVDAVHRYEMDEAPLRQVLAPADAGADLAPGDILHLHSTDDFSALLGGLPQGVRLALTLHDCALLTGGCVHPLDCDGWTRGCPAPCPLGHEQTERVCAQRRALVARLAPAMAAPSHWLTRMARAAFGAEVQVIPNGVPWPEAPPSQSRARRALGLSPGARVGVFVAHGGARAGYKSGANWPDYHAEIKRRVPAALCFGVGGDSADHSGDFITWPYVDRDKLDLLLAAADLLIYPTIADNHPLAVLEAMAQATAVVSYAVGGVPEQVVPGKTGLLVPPGDHAGFAAACARVLGDPLAARQMGADGFAHGATRFTPGRMAAGYAALYARMGAQQ